MKLIKKLFFAVLLLSIGVCTNMVHAMRQVVSLQGAQRESSLIQGRSRGGDIVVFGMRAGGAYVQEKNNNLEVEALLAGAIHGQEDAVWNALRRGACVDIVGPIKRTPLMWAVYYEYKGIVSMLLDGKADIHARDLYGHTPLMIACDHNYVEIAQMLLHRNALIDVVDNKNNRLLDRATPVMREILVAEQLRRIALRRRKVPVVMMAGSRVNIIDGYAPDFQDHKEVNPGETKLGKINPRGMKRREVELGVVAHAKAELKAEQIDRASKDLLAAAIVGDIAGVQEALDRSADVNVKGKDGQTALMWAAGHGHEQMVCILLDGKADVDAQDFCGFTPLMDAIGKRHVNVVRAILDHKGDINRVNCCGDTPLKLAEQSGDKEIMLMVLSFKESACTIREHDNG